MCVEAALDGMGISKGQSALTLHMPGVANAGSTRVLLLQLFPPRSALCPLLFFTLAFLDMFKIHFMHVLGMRQVLGGYVTCYKTLDYLACYVPLDTCNMMGGAKHDKVKEKKTGQRAD
jgi:hypothetical protein